MTTADNSTNVNDISNVTEEAVAVETTASLPTEDIDIKDEKKNDSESTESKDTPVVDVNDDKIVDINLDDTDKKPFRINGDNNRIVRLNPSDLSVITRIEEASKKYDKCVAELQALANAPSETEDDLYKLGKKFKDIDNRMRDLLDYIFQSNVSEVCAPVGSGSMYDPINGKYRYEYIIEALLKLYNENIQAEHDKMTKTVAKRTAKYTKKR